MLDDDFKKSAMEKVTTMSTNELKKAFKEIGSEPETNEEWFCQLSTEEKVNALLNLHEKVRQRMRTDIGGENSFYKGDYYREWLKQPHTARLMRGYCEVIARWLRGDYIL